MADNELAETNGATVEEIKTLLDGSVQRFHCQRRLFSDNEIVVSYVLDRERDLHGISLPEGTRTLAYFWDSLHHADKPFNIYHFVRADFSEGNGHSLAYYFNICDQCHIAPRCVSWRDLVVDIVGQPGTAPKVVDEDQLPHDLSATLRTYIEQAKRQIVQHYNTLVAELEHRSRALLGSSRHNH